VLDKARSSYARTSYAQIVTRAATLISKSKFPDTSVGKHDFQVLFASFKLVGIAQLLNPYSLEEFIEAWSAAVQLMKGKWGTSHG
jgi:hypothetical protein